MRPASARTLLLPALLALLLLPSQSRASGVSIRWDQCFADGGAQNKNFACDTNSGSQSLVGSFVPAVNMVDAAGLEVVLNLASDSPALPAWWQFRNAGTCRQTSLALSVVPVAPVHCPDWGQGFEAGGIPIYTAGTRGPNTATVKFAIAVPPSNLQVLTAGAEYFGFNLVIDNANTAGPGSCSGCTTPVCLVFSSVNLFTPIFANNRFLTGPSNHTDSDYASWQGGGAPVAGGVVGCPAATSTRQGTWGSVKALYR